MDEERRKGSEETGGGKGMGKGSKKRVRGGKQERGEGRGGGFWSSNQNAEKENMKLFN